ncbi:C6 transcription factor [Fusarium denticulatum]|uniref:C6 transcription factor n=1 Tax=Fusarium denticulatum TaxID=48507 RepID=A0A8H5T8N0_9HYPO|nr:C6 transcription factor [Fusarium denticulatum]
MEKSDTPTSPGQPSPKQPRPLKRKRAAVACDSCRVRKLKAICERCHGYGFQCTWNGRHQKDPNADRPPLSIDQRLGLLHEACADLPEETRSKVTGLLDRISLCISNQSLSTGPENAAKDDDGTETNSEVQGQTTRYVGELSDVHFLSLSRWRLELSGTGSMDNSIETYDRECLKQQPTLLSRDFTVDMPSLEDCQEYFETYFSTIHIAYPFIPKSIFMHRFQCLRGGTDDGHVTKAWLALFYSVLALGMHHRRTLDLASKGSKASSSSHETLFRRALALTDLHNLEASTVQVSALLARCFYLLATSQTDRCWVSLGVAVRLAQSLGMHVSHVESQPKQWGYGLAGHAQAEVRSRNWFCLFVLDQLLALQLGRPSMTSSESFCVPLPSTLDDSKHDWYTDDIERPEAQEQSVGDYFLHVIEFSKIVKLVVTELSMPQRSVSIKLASIAYWDAQLQKWKQKLPRHLQFYVGHAFNKQILFKRQRNMLAIKYHHIRTLIHRSGLELSCDPITPLVSEQKEVVMGMRRTCISEARSTMLLFHYVQDVGEIVHDFPWWQIISCLLCAGTVLVVSSTTATEERQELFCEAEACLNILDALGVVSEGALIARNMLTKLLNKASSSMNQKTNFSSADAVDAGFKFPGERPSFYAQMDNSASFANDQLWLSEANFWYCLFCHPPRLKISQPVDIGAEHSLQPYFKKVLWEQSSTEDLTGD